MKSKLARIFQKRAAKLLPLCRPKSESPVEVEAKALDFREFVRTVYPRYQFRRVHNEILSALDQLESGEILNPLTGQPIRRMMVMVPPRHGKTELVSKLFPAWYLRTHPTKWVAVISYSASLAYSISKIARGYYTRSGGLLDRTMRAIKQWCTEHMGGLWASGVGGEATGKGWHRGVIDDPIKNVQEATSARFKTRLREWYQAVWSTRQEEDPIEIIVQTRWADDDLCGWLLDEERRQIEEEGIADGWYIVFLPAISMPADQVPAWPSSCIAHPEWREPGEALDPEKYPIDKLDRLRVRIGEFFFRALYQQCPTSRGGDVFDVRKIEIVDEVPRGLNKARAWDKGATRNSGDHTAGVRMEGPDKHGFYYLCDLVRGQWEPYTRNQRILATAIMDGRGVPVFGPQDPGQAGVIDAEQFVELLAGFNAKCRPVSGAKLLRASPLAAQVNAGKVRMVRGMWNKAMLSEFQQFKGESGDTDDIVDAAADAFNELADMKLSGRRTFEVGGSR